MPPRDPSCIYPHDRGHSLNIDTPILEELKKIQDEEGKPLGKLVSEMLLIALDERKRIKDRDDKEFRWNSKSMNARIDIADPLL